MRLEEERQRTSGVAALVELQALGVQLVRAAWGGAAGARHAGHERGCRAAPCRAKMWPRARRCKFGRNVPKAHTDLVSKCLEQSPQTCQLARCAGRLSMGLLLARVLLRRPPLAVVARARLAMATAAGPRRPPPASLSPPPPLEEREAIRGSAAVDDDFRQAKRAQAAKGVVQREATEAVMRAFFGGGEGGGQGEEECGGGGGGGGGVGGGSRATVVLPGGAGKTVLALRVAEAMHARGALSSVLVLAPSLALVSQTIEEWKVWA